MGSLRDIARETYEILESGIYTNSIGEVVNIQDFLYESLQRTSEYLMPLTIIPIRESLTEVLVEKMSILEACEEFHSKEYIIGVINYADSNKPCGRWLGGKDGSEESLARSSGLFSTLEGSDMYLEEIRNDPDTDPVIFSPKVPFFRNSQNALLDEPYFISILSFPYSNIKRIDKALTIAYVRGIEIIIIPIHSIHLSNDILTKWKGVFRKIIFILPEN